MLEIFNSIYLDKNSKTPLYIQLQEKLKCMIEGGSLLPDFKLPSIRQLSGALDINQVTVVSAYRQLEDSGYAYSRPGSGTYVSNPDLAAACTPAHNGIIADELYQQDDIQMIAGGQIKIDESTVNFASATPTPDLFPVDDFKQALNEVLERDKGNAFEYQDSQGFYPLRECIAEVLGKSFSTGTPENIQVISGAQQGIDIISKAFLREGDFVITESPTYTGAIAVFKSRGAEIAGVELENDGPNLSIMEYNLKKYKPKLIYTIPSFQNPTGISYSMEKRMRILELAHVHDAYIIEDDYVSDLDFEGKRYLPLKALDKRDRVIFIKSFSKIFMPGLRLGFMVVPPGLKAKIMEAKHSSDISTSGLIQRAFDLYIRKGYWDKHFTFMYEIYRERYMKISDALERNLPPTVSFHKPGGGLNIWLNLPYGFSVGSLAKRAAYDNIVFAPGKIFYSSNCAQPLNNLRLSFAAVYADQISSGIGKLCELMCSMTGKQNGYRNIPVL